jgi:rare lipoprotein A
MGNSVLLALSILTPSQGNLAAPGIQKVLKTQTGLATFYSSSLHGKKTASGERYEKTEWVAAHPSYPLGTVARVTNLRNNKSVKVRIIDRGPTRAVRSKGVIIDLSNDAAKKLGFIREGRARVRVDVLAWGDD